MADKEILKRLVIILGILNAGVGSIIQNNTLIVIGTVLGILGAMMLVGILKW